MTDYIRAIRVQLRDKYNFTPIEGSTETEPLFESIPDGEYPMEINGKTDKVRVENGKLHCCNFD